MEENKKRNEQIVEDKKTMSFTALSRKYNLSIGRLQDIIKKYKGISVQCPSCKENITIFQ